MADSLISASGDTVYRDHMLLVERIDKPMGFRFTGEIDLSNSVAIARAIGQAMNGQPRIHLDLTPLVFCDVGGIRALVNVAQAVPDRQLLIHGLAPELERMVRLVGWSERSGLYFCQCTELRP